MAVFVVVAEDVDDVEEEEMAVSMIALVTTVISSQSSRSVLRMNALAELGSQATEVDVVVVTP